MSLKAKSEQSGVVFYSFFGAFLLTLLVCFLLSFVPNELDVATIKASFVPSVKNFVAETSEKLQYILGTVTFVVSYFLIGAAVKRSNRQSIINADYGISILLILMLGLFITVLSLKNPFIKNLPDSVQVAFFVCLGVCAATAVLFCIFPLGRYISEFFKDKQEFFDSIFLVLGLVAIMAVSAFFSRETYFYGAPMVEHHTDAYFYPIWKVWSGQYPLADFNSLYGYYPYFFVAIMDYMGGVSMENFSTVISVMVALVFILIYYVLWTVCKRKIIALLGLLSIQYILIMYNVELTEDFYLQYLPHRMITLCMILAVCCADAKYRAKRGKGSVLLEILGWGCSGIALLWNLDTGVVAWLGWAIYLCFVHLVNNSIFSKKTWLYILITLLKAVAVAFISFGVLLLLTLHLSGEWIGFKELFWGQGVFWGSGYYMLKMKLFHPWLIVMFTYAIALAISISRLKDLRKGDGENTQDFVKTALMFMLAVVGVGVFLYYQGRSHDFVFVVIVWPALMLAAMFVDGVFNPTKEEKPPIFARATGIGWRVILTALLLTFTIGWCVNMFSTDYLEDIKSEESVDVSGVECEVEVITESGISPDDVELLTSFAAETYEYFDVRYMPPTQAEVDIFTYEDVDEIKQLLKTTDKNAIIGSKTLGYLNLQDKEEFQALLESRFTLTEIDGYLVCYKK